MSQQQQQDQKLKSSALRKVGFTAVAISMLSIAFSVTQPLFFQDSNSVAAKFEKLQKLDEHNTTVSDVKFSPDGQMLASASFDGTIKLWDITTGKNLKTLEGHSDKIYSVSFSLDGKILASASADKTIKIWNRDGSLKKVLQGHDAEVTNVSFCPDNQVIVSSNADNTISLWNVDGKLVKTLNVGNSIRQVDCSFGSKLIAVYSDDNILRVWSLDGQELQTLKFSSSGSTEKISLLRDNNALFIANDDIKIKGSSLVRWLQGWLQEGKGDSYNNLLLYEDFSFSKNKKNLNINANSLILKNGFITSTATSEIKYGGSTSFISLTRKYGSVISTATREQANAGNITIDTKKSLTLKDGASISTATGATGNGGNISLNSRSLTLKDGASISTATYGQGNAGDIKITASDTGYFDQDWSKIISSSTSTFVENHPTAFIDIDNTALLLIKRGSLLYSLKHNNLVRAFDFHPNNKIIASGCDDGTIYFWDVTTGRLIRHFQAHKGKVSRIHYSLDGQKITSASDDGTVKYWYSDSPNFTVVIIVLSFLFAGSIVLFVIIKRQQSKQHNKTSNTQSNYIITGWVVCVLPEDWRGNLEALRYELITAKNPTWYVRFITVTTLLDMLFGGIRVKWQNFYDGNNFMAVIGRRSITDIKDKSK